MVWIDSSNTPDKEPLSTKDLLTFLLLLWFQDYYVVKPVDICQKDSKRYVIYLFIGLQALLFLKSSLHQQKPHVWSGLVLQTSIDLSICENMYIVDREKKKKEALLRPSLYRKLAIRYLFLHILIRRLHPLL